jgi:cytochrome P450
MLQTHFDSLTGTYDFSQLTEQPILQSLHAETTRCYSSNVSQRVVTTPVFALDEKYTITEGTTVFIYNKYTGLFTSGWTAARPHAASRPLETFWAERFLVPEKGKSWRFSDAGLSGTWTSYGGGKHKCPGRHFARNVGIVALALLLGEFECELLDGEGEDVRPRIRDTAFGKIKPVRKVGARLRWRRKGNLEGRVPDTAT